METKWTQTEILVRTKVVWVKLGKEVRSEMGFQARYSSRGGDVVINGRQAIP